nr:MAG TPA: hypothetical protein [Caudoviricetes sp.]
MPVINFYRLFICFLINLPLNDKSAIKGLKSSKTQNI